MFVEKLGVPLWPELVQQLRRALDVGEEQRHLPLRQIRAHAADDDARVLNCSRDDAGRGSNAWRSGYGAGAASR
jgi:hypothetical protein